jgi:protein O-GlcNAc transferase
MSPAKFQAQLQAAVTHHLAGRWDEAARLYENLRLAHPADFQVNHLLGSLRQQQGRPAEALVLLEKARRSNPRSAPTLMCIGLVLDALGRRQEAETALRESLRLDPKSAEAWVNLGSLQTVAGRLTEAIASIRHAVELKPDYAHGWTALGTAVHLAGRGGEAISHHTRALELEPGNATARFARAQALFSCHRPAEALADFETHLARRPQHLQALSYRLLLLNYRDDLTREQVFAAHVAYGRAVEAAMAPAAPSATKNPELKTPIAGLPAPPPPAVARRLRVAFLSPDLRTHSVAFFLEPLLAHLDRTQFETFLYHDHFAVDAMSERLRQHASHWRHVVGQADVVLEAQLRADSPDILIDLTGHTGMNRLPLFARRLAPVQLSYLGYPNTTGLRAMDYRLTDAWADPVGETDRFHTETLVRFAPTAWCYTPPTDAPAPASPPSQAGRPLTFGSFNALSKVGDHTLGLWREVLAAVPGARIAIKSFGLEADRWQQRLAQAGIALDRVSLLQPTAGIAEHLAAYGLVDIALDPFPYHGTTTTCEALWMGVPVITLAGDRHAARVGVSLLHAVGHPEWIAQSDAEYVAHAVALAADPARLAAIRATLRTEMSRSPLLDHASQAGHFGAALRQIWQTHGQASRGGPIGEAGVPGC